MFELLLVTTHWLQLLIRIFFELLVTLPHTIRGDRREVSVGKATTNVLAQRTEVDGRVDLRHRVLAFAHSRSQLWLNSFTSQMIIRQILTLEKYCSRKHRQLAH